MLDRLHKSSLRLITVAAAIGVLLFGCDTKVSGQADTRRPRRSRVKKKRTVDPQVKKAVLKRQKELYRYSLSDGDRQLLLTFARSVIDATGDCTKKQLSQIQLDRVGEGVVPRPRLKEMGKDCQKPEKLLNDNRAKMLGKAELTDRLLINLALYADWYGRLKHYLTNLKIRSNRPGVVRAVGRLQSLTKALLKQQQTLEKMGRYLKRKEIYRPIKRSRRAFKKAFIQVANKHGRYYQFLIKEFERQLRDGVQKKPFNLRTLTQRYLKVRREADFHFKSLMRHTSGDTRFDKRMHTEVRSWFEGIETIHARLKDILTFLAQDPVWKKTRATKTYQTLIDAYNKWVVLNNRIDLETL